MNFKDDHFRRFASWLAREIAKYGQTNGDFYDRQKAQFDNLIRAENEFRAAVIAHPWGAGVYRKFVQFICEQNRNILAARPYFRERQTVFTRQISKALKKRKHKRLYRFHFNYKFVLFAMGACKWHPNSRIAQLADEIGRIRTEIVEMNMPLAISRARIFWSRTPKSHLTLMDFIQIASEGLMSGVDKFVPPFARVFRAVAIGRMTGNFIEEYSETPIHFYPCDKRKIYRAHKLVAKISAKNGGGLDYERLAAEVNSGVDGANQTNPDEIAGLMAAASVVSADSIVSTDPDAPEPMSRYAAPESCRPDRQLEEKQAMLSMADAIERLTVFEQKLLRLKGLSL